MKKILMVIVLSMVLIISTLIAGNLNLRAADFNPDVDIYGGVGFLPLGEYSTFGFKGGAELGVTTNFNMLTEASFYTLKAPATEFDNVELDLSIYQISLSRSLFTWGEEDDSSLDVLGGIGLYRFKALGNIVNEFGVHIGPSIKQNITENLNLKSKLYITTGVESELLDQGLIELSGGLSYSF